MSCVYDGPIYPCVEEGIRMFELRYRQVVGDSLPLLRYTKSMTVKTENKELTAWCVASGYHGDIRYYLGMDGIVYILVQSTGRWVAATPEYFAQTVRLFAWCFEGKLNVPDFLSRIEDVLRKCEALAYSLKGSQLETELMVKKVSLDFCI